MTSYSVFVPESDDARDVTDARVESFVHGAARAVLDLAELRDGGDHSVETPTTDATDWHSPVRGWELRAIHPDDRQRFRDRVEGFARGHLADLGEVAETIAALPSGQRLYYVNGIDAAWYRAGYLFTYTTRGEGIGLWEYGPAGKRLNEAIGLDPISAFAYPVDHPDVGHAYIEEI